MSKLNKKLLKSIAKELEKSALLSEADLSSVAGGAPALVPVADLPSMDIRKKSLSIDPEADKPGLVMYTATNGQYVQWPTIKINGVLYAIVD